LRTLQRHVREWRAEYGPPREVFFSQEHRPGHTGSIDFTHATELGVTVQGAPLVHLLFHFILAFSGWHYVELAFGETFEALVRGLQNALFALGGVPERIRQDNLSAATHELAKTGGRALTTRFAAVLDHFHLASSRIQPGEAHENGVVERGHRTLKSALEQALILRGSRDFSAGAEYMRFVQHVVDTKLHPAEHPRLAEERLHLRPLPLHRLPEYTRVVVDVRKWSTIHVGGRIYSVPSRLIGHEVEARLFPDVVEVRSSGKLVETMPRLRGEHAHRIDYRHIAWSLARKPGAFASYRFREDLFPSLTFRRAYDALRTSRGDRADIEYVRILHLAASTSQACVERALEERLAHGGSFDYVAIKACANPEPSKLPEVNIGIPDLAHYDALLTMKGAS
jgi:hypothetical protein